MGLVPRFWPVRLRSVSGAVQRDIDAARAAVDDEVQVTWCQPQAGMPVALVVVTLPTSFRRASFPVWLRYRLIEPRSCPGHRHVLRGGPAAT